MKYFGPAGLPGPVGGKVINPAIVTRVGYALGTVLKKQTAQPCVLLGRDTRISGELLQGSLQQGLILSGVDVVLLGILSTPAIAYFTQRFRATAGIVISASHNPYQDNGIKIVDEEGHKLSESLEIEIETAIDALCHLPQSTDRSGSVTLLSDTASQYISHCMNLFSGISLSGYQLVIDCANGATSFVAENIFSALGAQCNTIHAKPDGFNINALCGATDVADLQLQVRKTKATVGLAFDGDGDRLMMVDATGTKVDGDEILGILALHDNNCRAVAGTLMSNLGLEKALIEKGIRFERPAVGDRYVLECLREKNWRLGGESSGHIVHLDYGTTGDGILTALQVLSVTKKTGKSLQALTALIQKRPQILINVFVESPQILLNNQQVQLAVKEAEKKLGDTGRVLLRASGTESCVRVMVEANNADQSHAIAKTIAEVVRAEALVQS